MNSKLFAVLGLVSLALTAPAQAQVKVGDQVDYTFRQPPADSFGVSSFQDLRGKPVLVEFWGTR